MEDNYIDQFGGNMKSESSDKSRLCYIPLAMGIISFVSFAVYLLSALFFRSVVMCIIYFVPLCSIVGLVFSFVTRNDKGDHEEIWLRGLISSALSFVLFFIIYLASWAVLAQR